MTIRYRIDLQEILKLVYDQCERVPFGNLEYEPEHFGESMKIFGTKRKKKQKNPFIVLKICIFATSCVKQSYTIINL